MPDSATAPKVEEATIVTPVMEPTADKKDEAVKEAPTGADKK